MALRRDFPPRPKRAAGPGTLRYAIEGAIQDVRSDIVQLKQLRKVADPMGGGPTGWVRVTWKDAPGRKLPPVDKVFIEPEGVIALSVDAAKQFADEAEKLLASGEIELAFIFAIDAQRQISQAAGAALGIELGQARERSKKGGKARVAADPKQTFRAEARKYWLYWRANPSLYKSTAEWARAVHGKQSDMSLTDPRYVKDPRTLERWARDFKKDADSIQPG